MDIMRRIADEIKVGVTPLSVEEKSWDWLEQYNVRPAFYGVVQQGSPAYVHSCNISVNDAILHGVPSGDSVFESGDIVKLDFGIIYKGYHTDHCFTFVLEDYKNEEDKKLVSVAKLATETAVKRAIVGKKTGDLGDAMYAVSRMGGFDVLKSFVGHGIGRGLHEEPQIPAYGIPGKGDLLVNGQVICVESQVVKNDKYTIDKNDGWTVKTIDGGNSAMFEYMIIVRPDAPEVLTDMRDWEIVI